MDNKKVFIFFVGGVTYSEIAAIKYIQKNNPDKHIIIGTTNIINGDGFVRQFF